MSRAKKIVLTALLLVVTALAAVIALTITLAGKKPQLQSGVRVEYTAPTPIDDPSFFVVENNVLTGLTEAGKQQTKLKTPSNVTSIAPEALLNNTTVQTFEISEGVVNIYESALQGCTSLVNITLPNSVNYIEDNVFLDCSSLENTYISSLEAWCNITFWGPYATPMTYAENLYINGTKPSQITVPNNITTIKDFSFYAWTFLADIELPSNLTSIGIASFGYCWSLQRITIPNNVTRIDINAFRSCTGLNTVEFSSGSKLTSLGSSVFKDDTNLTSVTGMPRTLTIGAEAFDGCSWQPVEHANLNHFNIENGVLTGLNTEFSDLPSSYTNLVIPDGVTKINNSAFLGNEEIETLNIAASVEIIDVYAFSMCSKLKTITFPETSSLKTISQGAFDSCVSLEAITLPEGLITIGDFCFADCTKLNEVVIPSSVATIGDFCFARCAALSDVEIVAGLHETTIGEQAFEGCTALSRIVIPSRVISIGANAFRGCLSLAEVVVEGANEYSWSANSSSIDLTDPARNAIYFKDTYSSYSFWR